MSKRRNGREAAVQYLFSKDVNSGERAGTLEDFWKLRESDAKIRSFTGRIVQGVLANHEKIDAALAGAVRNYQIDRLAGVDRNILRVAVFEMLFCEDVPPVVAINEAIEIAKSYGTDESGRFVNGILDRIARGLPRPARVASKRSSV